MSFESVMLEICNNLLISPQDRASYTADMEELTNFIVRELKQNSLEFRQCFIGLSLTGSYLDRVKIKTPDEFDLHVKLNVANLTLRPVISKEQPGFINLCGTQLQQHYFVRNGCVSRGAMQTWMRNLLNGIFKNSSLSHKCNGRTYQLKYTLKGIAVAHTITAIDFNDRYRQISFDFVPVIEFGPAEWPYNTKNIARTDRSWFAVPAAPHVVDGDQHFMVCAPHWERELLYDKVDLKNALRMMKALRDANELNRLSSYMIKSLFMYELEQSGDRFWQQSIGAIVVEMLGRLVQYFERGSLHFYWKSDIDLFDLIPSTHKYNYKVKLQSILQVLKRAKSGYSVDKRQITSYFLDN